MGIITKPEPRLVEVTSLQVIYVDDIGKLVVEGSNARLTYIEYRTFGTERVKMPVLEVVRPFTSCQPDRFSRLIRQAVGGDGSDQRH